MTIKTYNLYFGEGKKQVKYYTPPTPEATLQGFIDDPDTFKQYVKDIGDEIQGLTDDKADLTQERDDLKDDVKDLKKELKTLTDFLKDELGYDDIADVRTALAGEKLPDILTNADTAIKVLKGSETKLKGGIAFLQNQVAGMVDRDELKRAVEAKDKAVKEKGNLQNLYDPLKLATDQLLNEWSVADLNELDDEIKQLDTNNKVRLQIINKYGVANMKKLDEYIVKVENERETEKQKIAEVKDPFNRIVDRINKKKTVIVGDIMKTNIRQDLNRIKGALGYADINADIDSGEE